MAPSLRQVRWFGLALCVAACSLNPMPELPSSPASEAGGTTEPTMQQGGSAGSTSGADLSSSGNGVTPPPGVAVGGASAGGTGAADAGEPNIGGEAGANAAGSPAALGPSG